MPRVPVHHLTPVRRLPLIEESGLRTRADLSELYGPPGAEDAAAPGTYAHGRRVSAYLDQDHAREQRRRHGPGLVTFTVDPSKALAVPGSARSEDPATYWEAARPLTSWLTDGSPPADLEVHQNVPVRVKHLTIHAPLVGPEDLGAFGGLVASVADADRLSAKALMHVAIIASDGDFESDAFLAATTLAYRGAPDPPGLVRELAALDPDKVASAALAEFGSEAPDAATRLREALEETRSWADAEGLAHGEGLFVRSAAVLEDLPAHA